MYQTVLEILVVISVGIVIGNWRKIFLCRHAGQAVVERRNAIQGAPAVENDVIFRQGQFPAHPHGGQLGALWKGNLIPSTGLLFLHHMHSQTGNLP